MNTEDLHAVQGVVQSGERDPVSQRQPDQAASQRQQPYPPQERREEEIIPRTGKWHPQAVDTTEISICYMNPESEQLPEESRCAEAARYEL